MEPVKIGLLGLGTVGGGTVNVLARNREEIARRAGRAIEVVHASARDLRKPRICSLDGIKITDQPMAVVDDPEVSIVVELLGGTDVARELTLHAIDEGKHVVTANKALIALHGNEIGGRGRYSHHQGDSRGSVRQPHRVDRRHHQRHR
jgi:homoserine dehydrogenase